MLLVVFACTTKKTEYNSRMEVNTADKKPNRPSGIRSFEKEAEVYGQYYFPLKDISLDLTSPNNFALAINESHGDMMVSEFYALGQFEFRNDTITLIDSLTNKIFTLLRINEETLKTLQCEQVPFGENFLCWTKFYPNGEVKFSGGWEYGKKEGDWTYIDESGKETYVFYENGAAVANHKSEIPPKDTAQLPTFPGGFEEFRKYLRKNYRWKQGQTTIAGTVYVQFEVLEDGSISNAKIVRGLCESCDREAIRLIEQMPRWEHHGKHKRQTLVLPIKFGLTNPYE